MEALFEQLSHCIEFGKINKQSPFPPDMKDQEGADEITKQLLDNGASAEDILKKALIVGMEKVGVKFRENKVFVPQVLMSAKAMDASMTHLKPHFENNPGSQKGTFIIGTVAGDLHDIGKNLVAMMVEGNGYNVIDLGTDVKAEKFIEAADANPGSVLGLSALLTTTMDNMEEITKAIKNHNKNIAVCIGGAPVNQEFCDRIGADSYNPDPQGVVEFLNKTVA